MDSDFEFEVWTVYKNNLVRKLSKKDAIDEDSAKRPVTCKLEAILIEDVMKMISRIEE